MFLASVSYNFQFWPCGFKDRVNGFAAGSTFQRIVEIGGQIVHGACHPPEHDRRARRRRSPCPAPSAPRCPRAAEICQSQKSEVELLLRRLNSGNKAVKLYMGVSEVGHVGFGQMLADAERQAARLALRPNRRRHFVRSFHIRYQNNLAAFEKYMPDIANTTFRDYKPVRAFRLFCTENGVLIWSGLILKRPSMVKIPI